MSKKTSRAISASVDQSYEAPPAYEVPVYRLQLVKEGSATVSIPITKPEDVALLLPDVAQADREHMVALYLNTKLRVIGRHTVSIGTLNTSLCHPREVLKLGLVLSAHAFVIVHNHPSGDLTPSVEDDQVTRTIAQAGHLLQVRLLDHIILGPEGGCFSYQAQRPDCLNGGTNS